MVKHMIIWFLKDGIDKALVAADIKKSLEGLVGKIDGLEEMHILTEKLSSSSGDIMMDSTFTNNDALKAYQAHPLHLEIANTKVRPNVENRLSFDYEV